MKVDKATYMDIVQQLDLQALEAEEVRQAMEARLLGLRPEANLELHVGGMAFPICKAGHMTASRPCHRCQ